MKNLLFKSILFSFLFFSCQSGNVDIERLNNSLDSVSYKIFSYSIKNENLKEAKNLISSYEDSIRFTNDKDIKANFYYACAINFVHTGEFKKAYVSIQKAIQLAKDKDILNRALISKGEIFRKFKLFDKVFEIYSKIEDENHRLKTIKFLNLALVNLKKINSEINETKYTEFLDNAKSNIDAAQKALGNFNESIKTLKTEKNWQIKDTSRLNAFLLDIVGNYYFKRFDFDNKKEKHLHLADKAIKEGLKKRKNDNLGKAESYRSLGGLFYRKYILSGTTEYLDTSIVHFHTAYSLLEGVSKKEITGKLAEVLDLRNSTDAYKDSVLFQKKNKFTGEYTTFLKEKIDDVSKLLLYIEEEEKAKAEVQKENKYIIMSSLFSIIILISFFLLRIRKKNIKIDSQYKEINKQYIDINNQLKNIELSKNIGKSIVENVEDKTKVISIIIDEIRNYIDFNIISIGLINEKKNIIEFRPEFTFHDNKAYRYYQRDLNDKNQLAVVCVEKGVTIFSNDIASEYPQWIENWEFENTRELENGEKSTPPESVIYVPLIAKSKKIGVLGIQSHEKNAFTENDLKLIEEIVNYPAIAIHISNTLDNLKNTNQQLLGSNLELKQTKLKLQDEKEKNKIIHTSILHEIKNLFPPITLMLKSLDKSNYETYKHEILKHSGRLYDYIGSLKNFLNLLYDNSAFTNDNVAINKKFMNELIEPILSLCYVNQQQIVFLDSCNCDIETNKNSLQIILRNLLMNGIKYGTDENVYLQIKKQGKGLNFIVRNKSSKNNYEIVKSRLTHSNEPTKGHLGLYLCRKYGERIKADWNVNYFDNELEVSFFVASPNS